MRDLVFPPPSLIASYKFNIQPPLIINYKFQTEKNLHLVIRNWAWWKIKFKSRNPHITQLDPFKIKFFFCWLVKGSERVCERDIGRNIHVRVGVCPCVFSWEYTNVCACVYVCAIYREKERLGREVNKFSKFSTHTTKKL